MLKRSQTDRERGKKKYKNKTNMVISSDFEK